MGPVKLINVFFRIMVLSKENMGKYLNKTAHEVAKKKCKNTKIPADDEEVKQIQAELENLLISTEPKVKQVVSPENPD